MLGISALVGTSATTLQAQNQRDDIALVDQMISAKSKIDLTKELSIHLRLIKDLYSPSVYSLQDAKISYVSGSKTKARQAFTSIKPTDKAYPEMVFSYFQYANMEGVNDSTGKKEAATLYFESNLKNTVPAQGSRKRDVLIGMVEVYNKLVKSDEKKLAELKKWGDANGIVINDAPPIQPFIDANDAAEKIVLKDKGVDPKAKVNVKELETFIAAQIKAEWEKMDYWFFKGVIERARAYVLIGQEDKAMATIDKFMEKFLKMDEEVKQTIMGDDKIPKSDKPKMIKAASFMAGIYYTRGLARLIKAKKLNKAKKKDEAKDLLIGRTGAAVQFYLCTLKNKGSNEAFKSILRYGDCRDLAKKWFDKGLKNLKINPMEEGKAFYSLQYYEKALEKFDTFKTKSATKEGYEAMYLAIPSSVKSEQLDRADEYLDVLRDKYLKYNKEPNAYYTKMCLYMSGVYKKKMDETENKEEKAKFDQIRTDYYKRTLEVGKGNAPVAYSLANKEFVLTFELKKQGKKDEARAQYEKAIKTYEGITSRYPSSLETVKSYKKMAQLHEYFKDFDKAAKNYEAYSERLATPDVTGRIDKVGIMFGVANIYFQREDYAKTSDSLKNIKAYMEKEDLETSDLKQKKVIKTLKENSTLLSLFVNDKLSVPAKKELRKLKIELKENPENAELSAKVKKAEKDLNKELKAMVDQFKSWLSTYNSSIQVPNVMARLGGLYQEMNDSNQAKATYEKLRRLYPDHEVVKQISLNIVKVHLENEDIESAASAVKDAKLEELDKDSLRFLINAFLVEEVPADMSKDTLKATSEVVLRSTDSLLKLYKAEKADLNKMHWAQYRKARALYNLGKFDQAKPILEKAATEKKLGPYIFDIRFLLGAIASQKKDYDQVQSIYSKLMGLSMRMPPDLNRTVRINSEWSSAYMTADNNALITKGRNLAMMSKDTNLKMLDENGSLMVQKSFYLFIKYSKTLGEDITEARKEFLKKFPTSPYALSVRRL